MRTLVSLTGTIGLLGGLRENTVVMARRRRRRRLGGHTTAVGSGGRCAPVSTCIASHTHTARSLACPLLTLSSARPFSNGIFRSRGAPASPPPASASLTRARRMDGFCNQNADQLGYLAGPSRLTVFVGVVECASASPSIYSTHRFPDERTPLEATGAGKRAKTLSLQETGQRADSVHPVERSHSFYHLDIHTHPRERAGMGECGGSAVGAR